MKKYTKEEIKARFTSIHAWELPKETGAIAPPYVWTNKDMVCESALANVWQTTCSPLVLLTTGPHPH